MTEAGTANMELIVSILKDAARAYCASKWDDRKNVIYDKDRVERLLSPDDFSILQKQLSPPGAAKSKVKSDVAGVSGRIAVRVTSLLSSGDTGNAEFVDLGEAAGLLMAAGEVSTTQIMHFLDSVKTLKSGDIKGGAVARLRPQLAYAVSRKPQLEALLRMLEPWFSHMKQLDETSLKQAFRDFADFVESTVAFTCRYGK